MKLNYFFAVFMLLGSTNFVASAAEGNGKVPKCNVTAGAEITYSIDLLDGNSDQQAQNVICAAGKLSSLSKVERTGGRSLKISLFGDDPENTLTEMEAFSSGLKVRITCETSISSSQNQGNKPRR